MPDLKRTSSFTPVEADEEALERTIPPTPNPRPRPPATRDAHAAVLDALALAALTLDQSGLVVSANDAAAALLQQSRAALSGEPLLMWIAGAQGRAGFGREFMALARGDARGAFARDFNLRPRLGPPLRCRGRVAPLSGHEFLVTLEPVEVDADADAEFGRAVTRALDALDEGVMLVDADGRVIHSNPYVRELLGGRVEGRELHEVVDVHEAPAVARALSLAQSGSWRGEVHMRRLDGDSVPVGLALASGAGDGAPAVVLVRDLTASRQRAFEARLSAQVDRALLRSEDPRTSVSLACQALAVGIEAQAICVVTRVGRALERWRVQSDTSPQFQPLEEASLQWLESRIDEGRVVLEAAPELAAFGAAGAPETGAAPSSDLRPVTVALALQAPTGVVGYLLVELGARSQPRRERAMALVERVAPQLALGLAGGLSLMETRALVTYQSRLLDQTSVMLNSLDREGRVLTWNRASEQLLGVSADEAMGRRFGVEVAVALDPHAFDRFVRSVWDEGVATMEMGFTMPDGSEVPLHVEGRALREGARATGMVLVGLDLRTRRALESQVLRSQKLASVGLLAAGIAHEINNPLSGVVGYSRLLLNRELAPEIRDRVQKISDSAERCRKIVEGVLLFSRQGGGEPRPTALQDVVHRVTRIGEYQWRMHNVQILLDMPHPVEVMADPDQLEQVLLNLMSNAVDAMPRGGAVQIALGTTDDGRAQLEVTDSGLGIPPDVIPRIFDPFFSTKEIGKGTGLGLAISYGIIQDHGGDILVRSAPGAGTTFTVLLPSRDAPTSAPDDAPDPNETQPKP